MESDHMAIPFTRRNHPVHSKFLSQTIAAGAAAMLLLAAAGCSHTVGAEKDKADAATPSTSKNDSREKRMEFSHVGMVTTEKKAGELYVAATKVWVTNFDDHPYHIEWLRYEADSPVKGPIRELPHVAYRVESIKEASKGLKVLMEPFDVPMGKVGFYQTSDGAIVEFMEYTKEGFKWQTSEK